MIDVVIKKRTPLNYILLALFLCIDVIFIFTAYVSLFGRYAQTINKYALFLDLQTFYWCTVVALLLTFGLFAVIIIRRFPRENFPAALTLISSAISLSIIFFSTGSIVDTIYIYSLIECIGLLAGFQLTLLVPAYLRDELSGNKKQTYRSILPRFIAVYLMMLLIEFERYSYMVYSSVTEITTFTLVTWILTQLPVVVQRILSAYKYYRINFEKDEAKRLSGLQQLASERNRNLIK